MNSPRLIELFALAWRFVVTLAVFGIGGPLCLVVLALTVVLAFGAPVLNFLSEALHISVNPNLLFVAFVVIAMFVAFAAIIPMFCAGLVFAIAAFGFGQRAIWVAWLAAIVVFAGVLVFGALSPAPENSPIYLPSVADWRQVLDLTRGLLVPVLIAMSLCWLVSKPLHRVRSPA